MHYDLELLPLVALFSPLVGLMNFMDGEFITGLKLITLSPLLIPIGIVTSPIVLWYHHRECKESIMIMQKQQEQEDELEMLDSLKRHINLNISHCSI